MSNFEHDKDFVDSYTIAASENSIKKHPGANTDLAIKTTVPVGRRTKRIPAANAKSVAKKGALGRRSNATESDEQLHALIKELDPVQAKELMLVWDQVYHGLLLCFHMLVRKYFLPYRKISSNKRHTHF
jgi:hypothetical protein